MIHHNPGKMRQPGPNQPVMTKSGDGKQQKANNQSCKQHRKRKHQSQTMSRGQLYAFFRKRSVMMYIMKTKRAPRRVSSNAIVLACHHGSPEDAHVAGHCDRRSKFPPAILGMNTVIVVGGCYVRAHAAAGYSAMLLSPMHTGRSVRIPPNCAADWIAAS